MENEQSQPQDTTQPQITISSAIETEAPQNNVGETASEKVPEESKAKEIEVIDI